MPPHEITIGGAGWSDLDEDRLPPVDVTARGLDVWSRGGCLLEPSSWDG